MQVQSKGDIGDALTEAEALFGPTITLPTATVFSAAGALQAAARCLETHGRGEFVAIFGHNPPVLDLDDIEALRRAMEEMVGQESVALLAPTIKDVPDDDTYDEDPRVQAYDAALDQAEERWLEAIAEKFEPPLKTSARLAETARMLECIGEPVRGSGLSLEIKDVADRLEAINQRLEKLPVPA